MTTTVLLVEIRHDEGQSPDSIIGKLPVAMALIGDALARKMLAGVVHVEEEAIDVKYGIKAYDEALVPILRTVPRYPTTVDAEAFRAEVLGPPAEPDPIEETLRDIGPELEEQPAEE